MVDRFVGGGFFLLTFGILVAEAFVEGVFRVWGVGIMKSPGLATRKCSDSLACAFGASIA